MPIVNFHQQVPVELCRKASALVRREATAPRREVPIFDDTGTLEARREWVPPSVRQAEIRAVGLDDTRRSNLAKLATRC
jgi:hypothetical protein